MAMIKIKGHEFEAITIKDSFDRRALQFQNNIIKTLKKINVNEYSIDVNLKPFAVKAGQAYASWYFDGRNLHYSYKSCKKYVENLYVVSKVIEIEVNELILGKKTSEEFIHEFSEDKDVEDKRKKARTVLGVSHDSLDMDEIDAKYKELAKQHHPDMPSGSVEKFKEINHAHKTLKRELQ